MIRPANDSDLAWILAEGKRFFDASGYGAVCTYRPEDVAKTLLRCQIVLVDDQHRAMAAAGLFPAFMDSQTLMAQELFWWVSPEHRGTGVAIELLEAMENAAKQLGARAMLMLCIDRLDGNKVAGIYKRRGYRAAERLFMRKL